MKLEFSIEDNLSSYIDPSNGLCVFVETFDHTAFDVRVGTVEESESVGSVTASSSDELSQKVEALVQPYWVAR